MSSNHTMLTIGAFIILTTTLQNFYQVLGTTGDDISDAQDMILATTLTTSYLEIAQGMAFDEVTDTSSVALGNAWALTPTLSLGHDHAAEDTLTRFNDFDDFNRYSIEREVPGTGRRYRTEFQVWYVDPANVNTVSAARTFVKRIDTRTWRTFPPPAGTVRDTLHMSLAMGYFHFD